MKGVTVAWAALLFVIGSCVEIVGSLGCSENLRGTRASTCSALAYSDAGSFRWFATGLLPAALFLGIVFSLRPRRINAFAAVFIGVSLLIGIVTIAIVSG
jgi:hypothetical protein